MKNKQSANYWRFQKIQWRSFVSFLVFATIATIVFPWWIIWLTLIHPQVDDGFGIFFLIFPIIYAGIVIAAADLVTAIVYLATHKRSVRLAAICAVVILASALYLVVLFQQRL